MRRRSLLLLSLLPAASSTGWPPPSGCQAEACTVAIVLAGPFRGTPVSASEYRRVLLLPLLSAGFKIDTFAAGSDSESSQWREWLEQSGAGEGANASAHFLPLPSDAETLSRFPEEQGYFNGECADHSYHLKYHHLLVAWKGAQAHRPGGYDYAVRTRVDLSFGAHQFFKPCWLWEVRARFPCMFFGLGD